MTEHIKNMVLSMVGILVGLALIPVVFTQAGNVNWTIGDTDLGFLAYIIGLLFALGIAGVSVAYLVKSFKGAK